MRRGIAAFVLLIFYTATSDGRAEALAQLGAPLVSARSASVMHGAVLAALGDDAEVEEAEGLDEDAPETADAESEDAKDTEHARESTQANETDETTDTPWVENADEDYRFIGVRARLVYIPKFVFGLFGADGGAGVVSPSIGPEYVTRRNGFETAAWLVYSSYGMDDAPFKSKSDPDVAYEIVQSKLKTITVGADFLWTKPINDKGLSFVYGGGAGIGLVFGKLHRNQAYPPGGAPGDPDTYVKCPAQTTQGYCDDDNDHYGDYTEPSWFDGGARPVLFPWIAVPQIGLRWKPSKQFVMRVDTGLSLPGPFFLGISGQYGLL